MCRNCVTAARSDQPDWDAVVRRTRWRYDGPTYGTYVAPTFFSLEPEPQVDDGVDEATADALRWPLERRKP